MVARRERLGARAAGVVGAALALLAITAVASAPHRSVGVEAAPTGEPAVPSAPDDSAAEATPQPPQRLSETGLYRPDGSIDPRNRPFVPQYPLWSDGAGKSRWIRLPEGTTIDVSDFDAWRFPTGTTWWKEFAWHGRRVETRMIERGASGWLFATYVWNENQTEAWLAPAAGIPGAFEIVPGKRHSIPGIADCQTCHGSSPGTVLGFSALQLSDDRDPLAPHTESLGPGAVTLRTLVDEGLLSPPRPELVLRPPRIRQSDPVARAAMGYLSANCGGCHNARGPLARLGFSLLHDAAGAPEAPEPALATAVDLPGRYLVPGVPSADSRLVAVGAPQRSALLYRMQSRRPSSQMPPLGSVIADEEAIALVRRWIESLAALPAPDRVISSAPTGNPTGAGS
jgi:hypothetical protein